MASYSTSVSPPMDHHGPTKPPHNISTDSSARTWKSFLWCVLPCSLFSNTNFAARSLPISSVLKDPYMKGHFALAIGRILASKLISTAPKLCAGVAAMVKNFPGTWSCHEQLKRPLLQQCTQGPCLGTLFMRIASGRPCAQKRARDKDKIDYLQTCVTCGYFLAHSSKELRSTCPRLMITCTAGRPTDL